MASEKLIIVPEGKCPLDVLAELGRITRNARIFLHKNAVEKLRTTADAVDLCRGYLGMSWKATEKFPATAITLKCSKEEWNRVIHIKASDIAFEHEVRRPEYLFFLQMEEAK